MYKRILLPIDSSSTSAQALAESIKLASEMRSKLRIVHVVKVGLPSEDDLEGIIDVGELTKKLHHLGQTLLDKAADTARRAGVEPETELLDAKKTASQPSSGKRRQGGKPTWLSWAHTGESVTNTC